LTIRAGVRESWGDATLLNLIRGRFSPYGVEVLPYPTVPLAIAEGEDREDIRAAKGFFVACPWYWLYDVGEDVTETVRSFESYNDHWSARQKALSVAHFRKFVNDFFVHEGVGWQIDEGGRVVVRSDAIFEATLRTAVGTLKEDNMPTAAGHLRFAVSALSMRPKANTSGAVSHATSAVECVLGEITGEVMTLGKYLDKNPDLFHPALKKGLHGIYGYASDEGARHGKEGTEPTTEDAEFAVATCSAVCTLLTRKHLK
jgi:hypothetical protein